jgi:hypothetical protein
MSDAFYIVQIAKVAHEANRVYCLTLGDTSQPFWSDAPLWQKDSAISGVIFHLDELKAGRKPSPAASHESWMKQKIEDGWKYGTIKDAGLKEHPCIVPYEQLSIEQRTKDYLFGAIVEAFYNATKNV